MPTLKARLRRLHARFVDVFHAPLRRHRRDAFYEVFPQFAAQVAAMPAPTVLEVGARNITRRGDFPTAGRFIGCDIHPGPGVDLVADVHALSQVLAPGSVDAAFSISVFEHLVYPWKAVLEINRVLKPGGLLFISTHPAWPAHELPWDFWRFPVAGLTHLLIPQTGFEVIAAAEGLPARLYSLVPDPPTRGLREFDMHLGVAVLARKIGDYDADKLRWDIDVGRIVTGEYPVRT